jgi:hypothetical protein
MPERSDRVPDDVAAHLTPEEQAVYEQVRRAQEAIDAAVAALGHSRDARARALLRTVKKEAEDLQHMLEWHSERRAVSAAPRSPRPPEDEPTE